MKHPALPVIWLALTALLTSCAGVPGVVPPAPAPTTPTAMAATRAAATSGTPAAPGTARPPTPTGSPAAPASATPALAPPPTGCGGPSPQQVASFFGPAIGASPAWAARFAGPEATLHVGFDGNLAQVGHDERGWSVKVLLVLEPQQAEPVTVRVTERDTGAAIAIQVSVWVPTTAVVLDPHEPAIPVQHRQWKEYPSTWMIPRAGCYQLEIVGPAGTMRVPFAAGR